jgi:hypothetical protein
MWASQIGWCRNLTVMTGITVSHAQREQAKRRADMRCRVLWAPPSGKQNSYKTLLDKARRDTDHPRERCARTLWVLGLWSRSTTPAPGNRPTDLIYDR